MSTRDDARRDTWILAVDSSRGADKAARYVARAARALHVNDIRVLNVRPPSNSGERKSTGASRAEALQGAERATVSARRILTRAEVGFSLEAPIGDDPAMMIVGAAENWDATEIVLGTRGMSALSSVTLGSVAYKVLHLARRTVTLVPDRARGATRSALRTAWSMLVAVDGSPAANRAVQHAARQSAGSARVRVVLLNVQPASDAGKARRPAARGMIDPAAQEEAAAVMRQAERILGKAGVAYERRVVRGDVVDAILATAAECGCERIVLGTRGRGAAKSLLLGSVAYGVVHHADVAVTVVRQALPAPVLLPQPGTHDRRAGRDRAEP